ncbi:MAG: 30S ribosomal protein S20 [Actinobacteria bacterium]|nr:30S ribosomal protein S20 [Actinomycetota bacterium]
MANIKSQIKRNRQNDAVRLRNKGVRSALKTYTKQFRLAVDAGDRETAEEAFRIAARQYDKAASKKVIHANNAAHHKSKMARRLQSM